MCGGMSALQKIDCTTGSDDRRRRINNDNVPARAALAGKNGANEAGILCPSPPEIA